ncbi:hypothetical protein CPB83DRAFT_657306 [Crepidotus variabilis]|uniref:Uncharacterized protein n=1 Tax=Crepidotus variabilis TaxID=179855 RepID=A0A9P6E781_9AGAR|nr:hypothetical protein CPB83DRAFT_657306 [Crepidotus variabilis]
MESWSKGHFSTITEAISFSSQGTGNKFHSLTFRKDAVNKHERASQTSAFLVNPGFPLLQMDQPITLLFEGDWRTRSMPWPNHDSKSYPLPHTRRHLFVHLYLPHLSDPHRHPPSLHSSLSLLPHTFSPENPAWPHQNSCLIPSRLENDYMLAFRHSKAWIVTVTMSKNTSWAHSEGSDSKLFWIWYDWAEGLGLWMLGMMFGMMFGMMLGMMPLIGRRFVVGSQNMPSSLLGVTVTTSSFYIRWCTPPGSPGRPQQ